MDARAWSILLVAPLAAGCLDVGTLREDPQYPGTYGLRTDERDSYLPSFAGSPDDVFPVLLVHGHVESPRTQTIVVCLGPAPSQPKTPLDAQSLFLANSQDSTSNADSTPSFCEPVADPWRGELWINQSSFFQNEPHAVAVMGTAYCYGGFLFLDEPGAGGVGWFPGRGIPYVYRSDGTFLIDGRYELAPGRALRYEYRQQADGHPDRETDPKIVVLFDFPGTWLKARIGRPAVAPPPARPPEAPLERVDLPRDAGTLDELLRPLLEREEWSNGDAVDLRISWMGEELFSVSSQVTNGTHLFHAATEGTFEDRIRLVLSSGPLPQPVKPAPSLADFAQAHSTNGLAWYRSKMPADAGLVAAFLEVGQAYAYDWVQELPGRALGMQDCAGHCYFVRAHEPLDGVAWRQVARPQSVRGTEDASLVLHAWNGDDVTKADFFADA